MSIRICTLTLNDAEMFFDLRLESLQNSATNFLSTYEEEKELGKDHYIKNVFSHSENSNVIFGAFLESNLIGCIGIYAAMRTKMSHRSLIWGMYVKPEYRRDGVGRSLLKEAVLHAKNKMECATVELSVEANNIPAIQLYESCGFKAWGVEPMAIHVDDKFYDEIHMKLIIER